MSRSRFRFLAPLLSASFAVQLVLAGVGATCVRTSDVRSMAGGADMVEMDMSSPGNARAGVSDPTSTDRERRTRGEAPCGERANPSTCQILSACATGFVSVAAPGEPRESALHLVVAASEVETPASRSVAPELPPPRA